MLYCITLTDIWNLIKKPVFIIIYMAIMVVLMLLIIVSAMLNERRMSKLADRLSESADKAEKNAKKRASRFDALRRAYKDRRKVRSRA